MACAPWDPEGCAADIAKSVAGDAFSSIAHDFAKAADSATNWLWGQMGAATAVHLGGDGFDLVVGIVLAITATVALGLFLVQLISSTLKRDSGGLARALKGLIVAFIGGGLAIAVTNVLLAAFDSLSAGVAQAATGQSLPGMGQNIVPNGAITATTGNPAAMMVLALATLVAVMIVWAALMIRKVLIVVSAVFAPLAFAGSLADITVSWTRRWIEVTVALIISKLVLVIIFVVGLGMLVDGAGQSGSGTTQIATQSVSGLLVLALAGFAPWLALKLVHWSGDQFHHLHALASTSAVGAQRMVQAPQKAQSLASSAFGAGVGAAVGTKAAASAPARPGGAGESTGQRAGASTPPRPGGESSGTVGSDSGAAVSGGTGTAGSGQSLSGTASPRSPEGGGVGTPSGVSDDSGQSSTGQSSTGQPLTGQSAAGRSAATRPPGPPHPGATPLAAPAQPPRNSQPRGGPGSGEGAAE